MAQDPPRTYDQGYPHGGTDGQQPTGHEHQQQAWYPQQPDQPADPWAAGQQQGWQPQPDAAWAPGHGAAGYADPYGAGQAAIQQPNPYAPADPYGAAAGYQTADPYAGYQAGTYPTEGYQAEGYQAGTHPTGAYQPDAYQAGGYLQGTGQAGADPYAAGQGHAPADPYGGYGGYGTGTADPQAGPADGGPDAFAHDPYGSPADAATASFPAGFPVSAPEPPGYDAPAAGPYDPADTAGHDDDRNAGDTADGPRSLADRARAAATAVISADHAPNRRTLMIRAGAGAAALAVLITAGVLASSGGGSDAGSASGGDTAAARNISVAHAKAWAAAPAAAGTSAAGDDTLVGGWLTTTAAVRADGSGVHAYALADGKPAWAVTPPAPGAVPCGLSPTLGANGLGAALFRTGSDPKSPCTLLAAVDATTGKTTWTKTLSDTKDAYAAHVSVVGDKVIAVGDDKVSAWAAADGKDLWQYGGPGKFCSLSGGAGGATVLLHSNCADSAPADQAVALNATDGKLKWWRGLNNQPKTVTVLSAEPAVVATTGADAAADRIFAWGAGGDPAAEIPVAGPAGRLDTARGTFDAAPTVYFDGHTMVTTLGPPDGGVPTAVAAYDLTTGKPQWTTAISEKRKARAVGLAADTGLLLAVDERLDQPAHLSRFALAGGQETQGGAFPTGTGSLLSTGRVLNGAKVVVLPEHAANFGSATAFQAKD